MTDVYIAYAREDRERVRLITEMLRFEGWDLWMDPFDLSDEISPAAELKLATARVILAFWSDRSRTSEIVRSEAATGLYKNKLMQARIDSGAPPRPFDQVESLDFSHWRGDIDDPIWRRLTAGLKQHAGEPAGTRALPTGRKPAMAPPPPSPPQAQVNVLPMSLSQPRPHVPPPSPPPRQPMFQAPPLAPPQPPPGYHVPPPQPMYQVPPPAAYQPPPQPPVYQPQPPAPPPSYQMAPQPQALRPAVFDPPPAPPPLPPQAQPPAPREREWRRNTGDELDFPEPRSGRSGGSIGYADAKRGGGMSWGPAAAAVLLIGSGVGLWFGDPFGWRSGGGAPTESEPVALAARTVSDAPVANGEPAPGPIEDTAESAASWQRVNRKSAEALRDFVTEFPRASSAETARSLLRVLDAQAWVTAVTSDNEQAYQAYLKRFPADGVMAGAMAAAATERLSALGGERQAAVEEIQRGLSALNIYNGPLDGKGGSTTAAAVTKFASSNRRPAPSLSAASPRELRAFAESVRRAGSRDVASAEVAADSEADKLRIAQAQAQAASLAAAPVPAGNADSLAVSQQQHLAEQQAWAAANETGTAAAYQAFLSTWPNGSNAAAARAALTKANRPPPFSLDQLSADVRAGVDAARKAQATANQRAAAARQAASSAESLTDAQSITGAGGDRYEAQIANGAPNGLGIRTRGSGVNAGDRYRGQLRNGQSSGVGVYEFADNPGNSGARALRYEGEYSGDVVSGHGVFYWRSGDSFAGLGAGGSGQARGVLTYDNGQRYEGELSAGRRDGIGVVWASDGSIIQAGRWSKDALAEPMKSPG